MNVSALRVSRWLLVLEWLVCFGPLTLLWMAAVRFIGTGAGASSDLATLGFRWFAYDWSLVVLLAVLPLLGCLHLLYASRPATSQDVVAHP